jgi:hypothetical protein
MKAKLGRPRVPKSEKRGILMQFKVKPDEKKRVLAAISKSRSNKSEWLRNAALAAAAEIEAVS